MLRMSLKLDNASGQGYDSVRYMAGKKNGVTTAIKTMNPKCFIHTHFYGQCLKSRHRKLG